jgi:hypothetical protein
MRTILALIALVGASAMADTPQQHVHDMSHDVMPFDMSKTFHVFVMNEQGGIQKVVVRENAGPEQIDLIRQHLKHEAEAFAKGDFADPGHLHGASMPGLAEIKVSAAAGKMQITYSPMPSGAQITFQAADLHTITAIHRWFGAQLSEHGSDAKSE